MTFGLYGQTVLFSEKVNDNWDLYLTVVEDGSLQRITTDSLRDFQSDFTKVHQAIVFDSYRDHDTRNIFTMDTATGMISQLTNLDTRDGHPVWSPDGSRIAFQSSRTGNPEVFVMDRKGGNIEQLTSDPSFDGIPKWSPNGSLLAFNSNRDGTPNVYILNFTPRKIIQITANESYNFIQDWVSDTEILIITDVNQKRQLQILDSTTGSLVQTIATKGHVTYARCNEMGQVVFTQKMDDGSINVFFLDIKNGELKQLTDSNGEKRFPTFMK
jgi:Tol biopolymer transport system component